MINSLAIKKLELVSVLKEASTYTQSISASEALMSLQPSSDYEKVNFLLAQTNEAKRLINYYGICPGFNFDTIIQVADKAKILSTLTMGELLRVKRMLSTARSVYSSFQSIDDSSIILLPNLASGIYFNKQIEEDIDYAIISEDEMNDRASEELYKIRNAIRKTNDEVKTKLAGYLHSSEMSKYLQDVIITMRQDRYVIPVKSEYRSMVSGLIHDQSASGATVFIEPMAIVTLNNKLKELMISERAEIEHILSEFTKQISCFAKELIANEAILVELDVVYAKAKYGDSIKATMPFVNNYGYINIKFGRHPLIDKNKIVPISVHIGDGFNVLLITGPNTGGKTVSLKTVGLFSLMASCGMMLPCHDESTISIFENIFCDIGDEQSIEQSLSTFSGHINNISKIMENLTDKTLVLIDEVGAGTEPNEGAALALAITEHILKSGSKAILTTHFSQLKEFSMITPNIENASMEFDPVTFAPTYKLIIGVPGSSNAIEIAKRLGLNEEIITSARGKLSEEKVAFENVLRQAESIRQDYEKAKCDVDKLKEELVVEVKKVKNQNEILSKDREQLLYNSKIESKRIIARAQEEAKELIEEIKSIQKRAALMDESDLFKARAVSKKIGDLRFNIEKDIADEPEDYVYGEKMKINDIAIGKTVYVKKLNSRAIVQNIDKNERISVRVGKMNTIVKIDELYYCAEIKSVEKKIDKSSHTEIKSAPAKMEINLLGKNVDESILEIDPFIDAAISEKITELRIIHGMGTGALRAGLHKYFKTDKRIKEFRLGRYGEGESGVTILTLKDDKSK